MGFQLTSSTTKTSLEAWQLFPEPGSSAASRQTATAGLMTEHTRFPSGLLRCAVRYSETKEIKDYPDSNKYVMGATRGRRRLGTVPSQQRWEQGWRSRRSRGHGTRLGQDSVESWVGIGSATDPGRGLGGLQHRHGPAMAMLDFSWKLAQDLARSQDFFFPLPLPRFSLSGSSDFLQLPAREHCAASVRSQPGGELLLPSPWARSWQHPAGGNRRGQAQLPAKPGGQRRCRRRFRR